VSTVEQPARWVQTVRGPVAAAALGPVLPHEHLLIDLRGVTFSEPDDERGRRLAREPITLENLGWIRRHWTSSLDNLHQLDEALAIRELGAFAETGGGTVVDATVPGIGRDPAALVRISEATGVHVVMGSGSYVHQTHPQEIRDLDAQGLHDRVVAEWRDGVDGSGIRPGLIGEVGCSWPLHPRERVALEAMSAAQRTTGLPVMIHPGRDPAAVAEILAVVSAAGMDLSRLIVAHLDRGITPHEELLDLVGAGVYVELDCFGLESSLFPPNPRMATLSDAQRLDIVRRLIDAGAGDHVLLAHDVCQKHRLTAYGGHGFGHLTGEIRPWMPERGFSEAETTMLFVTNPARALAIAPGVSAPGSIAPGATDATDIAPTTRIG
jgi:phosphotriesterase-related protein